MILDLGWIPQLFCSVVPLYRLYDILCLKIKTVYTYIPISTSAILLISSLQNQVKNYYLIFQEHKLINPPPKKPNPDLKVRSLYNPMTMFHPVFKICPYKTVFFSRYFNGVVGPWYFYITFPIFHHHCIYLLVITWLHLCM